MIAQQSVWMCTCGSTMHLTISNPRAKRQRWRCDSCDNVFLIVLEDTTDGNLDSVGLSGDRRAN